MDNVINFAEYKKKNKGGFAPVTVARTKRTNIKNKDKK